MKDKHEQFMLAAYALIEAWDETQVVNYPKYLPSFDEFVAEFSELLGK